MDNLTYLFCDTFGAAYLMLFTYSWGLYYTTKNKFYDRKQSMRKYFWW